MFEIELFICIKTDLALNDLQWLICQKTRPNKTKCSAFFTDQSTSETPGFIWRETATYFLYYCPRLQMFSQGNKEKSHGTSSAEYEGCCTCTILCFTKTTFKCIKSNSMIFNQTYLDTYDNYIYIYIYMLCFAGHCWRGGDELVSDVLL